MGIQAWVLSKMLGLEYRQITFFAVGVFIFFGISDFFEIKQGGLFGIWWLMTWKVLGLAGFVALLVWYIKLRLKAPDEPDFLGHTRLQHADSKVDDMFLFQCAACKMRYKDKKWADRCFEWCTEHHSCNLEIIEHAVRM